MNGLYMEILEDNIKFKELLHIQQEELIKNEEELLGKNLTQEQMQDVFRDKSLLLMENVIFTPHNAFNSQEAIERILDTTVQNIQAFLESGQISNRV